MNDDHLARKIIQKYLTNSLENVKIVGFELTENLAESPIGRIRRIRPSDFHWNIIVNDLRQAQSSAGLGIGMSGLVCCTVKKKRENEERKSR